MILAQQDLAGRNSGLTMASAQFFWQNRNIAEKDAPWPLLRTSNRRSEVVCGVRQSMA